MIAGTTLPWVQMTVDAVVCWFGAASRQRVTIALSPSIVASSPSTESSVISTPLRIERGRTVSMHRL